MKADCKDHLQGRKSSQELTLRTGCSLQPLKKGVGGSGWPPRDWMLAACCQARVPAASDMPEPPFPKGCPWPSRSCSYESELLTSTLTEKNEGLQEKIRLLLYMTSEKGYGSIFIGTNKVVKVTAV